MIGISHVHARSVSKGNDGYDAVMKEWKNLKSCKVNPVELTVCGN
jgi:hypothetical protein